MKSPNAAPRPNEEWLARTAPEAPLEPALPIVDPHVHLFHRDYKYLVEEYARDIAESGHNVEAMVYIEAHAMYRAHGPEHLKCVGETEFAVGMAAMAASGKYTSTRMAAGIVGSADLTLGEQRTRQLLEAHLEAANGRFRGVRQRAKWDPDPAVRGPISAAGPGLYLKPEFGEGLDLLAAMGLSFEASIFHTQIPDVTTIARAHPDANIVLIHSGSPVLHSSYAGRDAEVHANWLADMRELARCPNVSVKLGGLLAGLGPFNLRTTPPPGSEHLAELWRPYTEPCIELFGAERCMASSNFPVDGVGMRYGTLWNTLKRITAACSADEKRMIYSGTARRVYRLDDPGSKQEPEGVSAPRAGVQT